VNRAEEDLVIFTNGPGELSTWVSPLLERVNARPSLRGRYRVVVVIHPCQFGSGTEKLVAPTLPGVDLVVGPGAYLRLLLAGLGRRQYRFSRKGIIFSLGGDLMHPVLFRRRVKGRHLLYAYTNNPGWESRYRRIFVRSGQVQRRFIDRGVPPGKVVVTGDLVYSSLRTERGRGPARAGLGLGPEERMVAFLPGSRAFEVEHMVPVFLKVIDELTGRMRGIRPFFLKSPFATREMIERGLARGGRIGEIESLPGILRCGSAPGDGQAGGDSPGDRASPGGGAPPGGDSCWIEYAGGKRVGLLEGGLERWGAGIDLAVTLPGTNTVQLAYRKIPALVVAPLNRLELIPIEGPAGLLKWVPLGRAVLRRAVARYAREFRYASLPNLYEGEEVFPELFGVIRTGDVVSRLLALLGSGEERDIRERLERFTFETDPADIIMREVWGDEQAV
jgi:lipid-A-disaccharide synthase